MKPRVSILTAFLPDGRILLHKKLIARLGSQWTATREYYLNRNESIMNSINTVLKKDFGVDAIAYSDDVVVITRRTPIIDCPEAFIMPTTIEFKGRVSFVMDKEDFYKALSFEDLTKDVMENSIYNKNGGFPKHSIITIFTVRALHERSLVNAGSK